MKKASLIQRGIVFVLVIQAFCALLFVGTALLHERATRLLAMDIAIQGLSDSLMGSVQDAEDPGDRLKVDPSEFSSSSTDVWAVYNKDGQLVGSSSDAPQIVIQVGKDGFRNVTTHGRHYRILQREAMRIIDREETGGVGMRRPVIVLYASSIDHLWSEVLEAASFYVVLSIALLCLTAIALVFLLRTLLNPLKELAGEAEGVKTDSLAFHAPASALRLHELAPLAEALSATIARLRFAFNMEHRFINDAAHELKTAVAVVRSTVQVLSMRNRTLDEYRKGLDQVLADNMRVEELISRMLTLARFTERTELPPVEIDFSEHVQQAVKKLGSFSNARGVSLNSQVAPGVKVTLAPDAAQILASNLVMNAIQHSPSGTEVRVSVRCSEAGGRRATLVVQDFGSGIDARNLSKVFDRFFREDPSRSRETGGVGLGLAICKSIVQAADGKIEIESQLGEGTTITASFPSAS